MAITVTFDEYNGSAETVTAGVTNIAFGSTDQASFNADEYPIRVGQPSFHKYLKATFAGFAGETVSVAKIFLSTSGLLPGETIAYNGLGPIAYAIPSDIATGDGAIPTSLPGTQNLALGGSDSGTLVANGSSEYFRLQRTIKPETPIGQLPSVTLTLSYDVA